MAIHAFVAPILPGKTEEWRKWQDELNGSRRQEFVDSRRRLGVHERTFLQMTPQGDFVIVTLEGDDPLGSFKRLAESDDSFSRWFVEKAKEYHGFDLRDVLGGPLSEMVIDTESEGGMRRAA